MLTSSTVSYTDTVDLSSELVWKNLYLSLSSFARSLVYSFGVSSWRGQEEDIAEDIVQETMRRLLEVWQKAERGEASPIRSLNQLMRTIAQNYCKDLRRHDRRMTRIPDEIYAHPIYTNIDDQIQLLESVTERVYQESLFKLLAREIAHFPDKQRRAILIDLANRDCFDTQPTPLQKAFLTEGIQLEHYRQSLPADPQERSRHVSLLNHAYKRVTHLPCVKEYVADTKFIASKMPPHVIKHSC